MTPLSSSMKMQTDAFSMSVSVWASTRLQKYVGAALRDAAATIRARSSSDATSASRGIALMGVAQRASAQVK